MKCVGIINEVGRTFILSLTRFKIGTEEILCIKEKYCPLSILYLSILIIRACHKRCGTHFLHHKIIISSFYYRLNYPLMPSTFTDTKYIYRPHAVQSPQEASDVNFMPISFIEFMPCCRYLSFTIPPGIIQVENRGQI